MGKVAIRALPANARDDVFYSSMVIQSGRLLPHLILYHYTYIPGDDSMVP
jgi:hypothetical protein